VSTCVMRLVHILRSRQHNSATFFAPITLTSIACRHDSFIRET